MNVRDARIAKLTRVIREMTGLPMMHAEATAEVALEILGASGNDPMTPVPATNIRDFFAAHALQGILSNPLEPNVPDPQTFLSKLAYAYADAMLAAREKRDKPAGSDEIKGRR
jgi:aspartyl/asparaginyl beta-hydroxylase (cupin superfamily)